MIGDLFDSPWKVLIVAIVLIVLFGSKKLPDAARSLGRSMRILKAEVSSLGEDERDAPAAGAQNGAQDPAPMPQAQLTAAAPITPAAMPVDQQTQIDALQQQIRDLQRAAAMDPAPAAAVPEPQRTQPS
jgi:sec-independent protein translocase protein TatA